MQLQDWYTTLPMCLHSHLCYPEIHLWCDICWLYGGQHGSWAFLIHVLTDMSASIGGGLGQGSNLGPSVLPFWSMYLQTCLQALVEVWAGAQTQDRRCCTQQARCCKPLGHSGSAGNCYSFANTKVIIPCRFYRYHCSSKCANKHFCVESSKYWQLFSSTKTMYFSSFLFTLFHQSTTGI